MSVNIFAMPSSSIILLFSVALGLTNALPWTGAQKTAVYKADPWSPVPTAVPAAELFRRTSVDVKICGWIGGNSAEPAVCSSGSSCVHDTVHGYVGCCTTSGACTAGVYTACVDQNSAGWSPNSDVQENGIYTCQENSVCYRNTYPGGYYQYGCGSSDFATSVATTYSGQPSDMLLQVVYTGVSVFFGAEQAINSGISGISSSPDSASSTASTTSASTTSSSASQISSKASSSLSSSSSSSSSSSKVSSSSKASSSSSSSTVTAGAVSPTSSPSSAAASSTASATTHPSKGWSGAIAGGALGGIAGLAGIVALIFWFLRRRRSQQKQRRAPSFISGFRSGNPPASGPFQKIQPYSPDDFGSETTQVNPNGFGNTTTVFPAGPTQYRQPEAPSQPYFPPPPREISQTTPLVSEIDDFSRNFSAAIAGQQAEQERDTQIHTGELPDTVTGLGFGVGSNVRGQGGRNGRTGEYEIAREGLRQERDRSVSPPIPLRSPRRVTPSPKRDEDDDVQRYQLVDQGAARDDVPILNSPGQLRSARDFRSSRAPRGRYSP